MKQFYKIALMFVIGTTLNFTYGQVQVTINDVMVNSQTTVTNCNTIDFGTTTNNTLSFYFTLKKPLTMSVGHSKLKVMLRPYPTSEYMLTEINILPDYWSDYNNESRFDGTITANVSASSVAVSGSSVYLEFESYSNIKYSSCQYPIIKTPVPTFTLSSSVNSIDCGTSTPVAFTVTNVHNSPGYWEYLWNVGSGWNMSGMFTTTTNTISLTPVSYPLGQVKVTPIRNNHYYSQLSKSIGLNSFNAVISFQQGESISCSSGGVYIFNLSGVESNYTTNWSVSNNLANIISSTNSSVTLQVNNSGGFNIIAYVSNSCGQTKRVTKSVWTGIPEVSYPPSCFQPQIGEDCFQMCRSIHLSMDNKVEVDVKGLNLISNYLDWEWEKLTSNFDWTTDNNIAYLQPYQVGNISFRVRAKNICGWSDWLYYQISVINCGSGPGGMFSMSEQQSFYKVYPNPSNDVVYIELEDSENPPFVENQITGKLYDLMGNLKSNVQIINNQAIFSVQGLNTGIYVLRIDIDGTIEIHNIAVE